MASIGYTTEDGRLEVIEFDILDSHSPTHIAKATRYPVEAGAVVSDHVLQDPDVVRLTGLVTNAPIPGNVRMGIGVFHAAAAGGQFKGRAQAAYHALVRVKEAGTLVTIDTPLRWHEDMVLESVETSESAEAGDALTFTISACRIRTTSTQTVPVPKIEAAQPKASNGRLPTKPAEGPSDSVLKSLVRPSAP